MGIFFMKVALLQGTPWHSEQLHKSCNDGSKYCIYNHKICSCIANKKYYHKICVGKGNCEWFEPKTGTPKIYSEKTYKLNKTKDRKESIKQMKTSNNIQSDNSKETKEEKFLRLSKGRIDKIEEAISNLENLSDKYSYSYTDEQVDKMFDYLEKRLSDAKDRFKNKKSSGGFSWE